ncbi:unnamed protein product [Arabidopsis thaliana]|uniref:(thale cress) hypothetical protein n=1 Tax=Arabidopsis thaliana TaxID=3702 RepID=A0A7G2FD48_ARATH|nr:unnamed protein product [Arabidopsis thaliana]
MTTGLVTPGDVIGKATEFKAGKGAYVNDATIYASLTGTRRIVSPLPESIDQRAIVEVTGHKAHGPIPETGSVVIARVTKVMTKMAAVDILCVGSKAVRENFAGVIRQQDVRATEIDKVDMHQSFHAGDIVRAMVLSLGDARAYYLSTAKNELGVVSAESAAGETMVPISWTEMQCPLSGQTEQRKVAKVELVNTGKFLGFLLLLDFLRSLSQRRNKSFAPRRERKDSGLRELVKIFCEIGFPLSFSVKFESIDFEDMGAFCCCFQVDLFESYVNPNTSITRNCPCLNCFLQSFMDLYASLFSRGGMHPIPSTVETATVMNSTTALDDSLSSVYHSPPTPLPYDADPRYFRFVKGSSHSGEESEPLRGDTEMSSEALGDGGAKWSKSDSEDGSKEVYTKGSSTFTKSKTMPGIEVYYADSDDEDICPTCLDDYTLENPKIITKCSHHFHLSCIYEWMERSETCPVCGKVMAFDENETS